VSFSGAAAPHGAKRSRTASEEEEEEEGVGGLGESSYERVPDANVARNKGGLVSLGEP
jgi:hypothetical protein